MTFQFNCTAAASGISAGSSASDIRVTEVYRGVFSGGVSIAYTFDISGYAAGNVCNMVLVTSWDGGPQTDTYLAAEFTGSPGSFSGSMCWNGGGLTRCAGSPGGSPASPPALFGDPGVGDHTFRIFGIRGAQNDSTSDVVFGLTLGDATDDATALVVPNLVVPDPPVPGFWLDFARDGFNEAGAVPDDAPLVRMLPQTVATVTSDNITDDIISIRIDRQADLTGGTPVGTMTVVTKNTNGKYNPDNTSSPVYGQITPGTPVWFGCNEDLTLTDQGLTVYGRFAGRLKTVAPIPVAGATDAPTVEWVYIDAMDRLKEAKARVSFSETRSIAAYRTALLAAAGETRLDLATEADILPATGQIGITSNWIRSERFRQFAAVFAEARRQVSKKPLISILSVLEDLNRLIGSRHFIAPADSKEDWYTYSTRNRQYKLGSAADGALTSMVSDTAGYVQSDDGIENAMSVEVRPFRVAGQAVQVWEYGSLPLPIHTGSSKTIIAEFGDQVFDASVVMESLNGAVSVDMVAYGDGAAILLTTVAPDHITALSIDGRPVIRQDSFIVEREDAGSQIAYGPRQGEDVSSDLMTSEGLADSIAEYHLWANAVPRKSPSVTIINHPSTVLPLDLFDVVTLTIPQLDVSAKRFEIVGIHETWTVAASASLVLVGFTFDLRQTPNSSALSLFTIGVSTFGGSDGLAP